MLSFHIGYQVHGNADRFPTLTVQVRIKQATQTKTRCRPDMVYMFSLMHLKACIFTIVIHYHKFSLCGIVKLTKNIRGIKGEVSLVFFLPLSLTIVK